MVSGRYALSHICNGERIETQSTMRFSKIYFRREWFGVFYTTRLSLTQWTLSAFLKHIASDTAGILTFEALRAIEVDVAGLSEQEARIQVYPWAATSYSYANFVLGVQAFEEKLCPC